MERRTALLLATPALAVGLAIAPAAAALAAATGASATAKGSNEVGKAGGPKATANAMFTFDTSSHQLCYTVTATSLQAVAMHIHKGAAGANGPVVVPLDPTKIGAGKTCAAVAPALLSDISNNPAGYYFNTHPKAFPAGAVRGQLVSTPALVSTPTAVAAGNGGQAEGSTSALPVLLMLAGGAVAGAAGWRLLPRRRS